MNEAWNEGMATEFMIALIMKQYGISYADARNEVVAFVSITYGEHVEMVDNSQFGDLHQTGS
jgi:hypothetical protein